MQEGFVIKGIEVSIVSSRKNRLSRIAIKNTEESIVYGQRRRDTFLGVPLIKFATMVEHNVYHEVAMSCSLESCLAFKGEISLIVEQVA